jgi:hypothetical protein
LYNSRLIARTNQLQEQHPSLQTHAHKQIASTSHASLASQQHLASLAIRQCRHGAIDKMNIVQQKLEECQLRRSQNSNLVEALTELLSKSL